jgi:hypothetical protein
MPPGDALETGGVTDPLPLLPLLLPPPPPPQEVSVIVNKRTPKLLRLAFILYPTKPLNAERAYQQHSCQKSTIFAVYFYL